MRPALRVLCPALIACCLLGPALSRAEVSPPDAPPLTRTGAVWLNHPAPLVEGLDLQFSRDTPSRDALGQPVEANTLRHSVPTLLRSNPQRETVVTGLYHLIGGAEVQVYRNSSAGGYEVRRAHPDGTLELLHTLTEAQIGPSVRSITAALGNPSGFSDEPALGNYAVTTIRAANHSLGILRIVVEISKWTGTRWDSAQHGVFYSLDDGANWSLEYRTTDNQVGKRRGREWCTNPFPTPLYSRDSVDDALIVAFAEADYLWTFTNPNSGVFVLSIFTRPTPQSAWSHAGYLQFPTVFDVDHGHNAIALEYRDIETGRRGVQFIYSVGDGRDDNANARYIYLPEHGIDPADPDSLGEIFTIENWSLDPNWKHGTAVSTGSSGLIGNQWTSAFPGRDEGHAMMPYDLESGIFGLYEAGDSDATGPIHRTRGPVHPGGLGISLYAATDGRGRIVITSWDNALPAIRTFRHLYSDDWGESWTEISTTTSPDSRLAIAHGRLWWTEGFGDMYSRELPQTLAFRPASVSSGGTNLMVEHANRDAAGNLVDWSLGASNGVGFVPIQKVDGVFIDPDTGEIIPHPPSMSDTLLKVTVNAGQATSQLIGRPRFGRRHTGVSEPLGQADMRFWVLPARDTEGVVIGTRQATHTVVGDAWNAAGASGVRAFHKFHGRDRWYPIYAAGNLPLLAEGGARISLDIIDTGLNPGAQSFYIVPDFGVLGAHARIGQPIPLGRSPEVGPGVDGFAPDEVLTASGIDFGPDAASATLRCIARTPWDSWGPWSERGVYTTKTLWRLWADASNWIVCEWDASVSGLRVRAMSGGVERQASLGSLIAPMRETLVDLAISCDGDDLHIVASIAGERFSATIEDAAADLATLGSWQAGADELGRITPIEIFTLETFAEPASADALHRLLDTVPEPVTPSPPSCPGDVNGDGQVDLIDLNLVLANFGAQTSSGDANGDGVVNLLDLNLVLSAFGSACDGQ